MRRGSNSSGLPIVELLSKACQRPGEVAAGGPGLASDQRRAFVDRVAVLVVERHHGALLAAEPAVASIEVQIGFLGWLPMDIDGVGKPEAGEQPPACPNGTANTNLAKPRASLRWITQRV